MRGPADPVRRRLTLALGASLAGWPLLGAAAPVRRQDTRVLMGTRVDIAALAEDAARLQPAIDAAYARMAALAAQLSHYDPASAVSTLNRDGARRRLAAPPELRSVLAMARDVSQRSDGAFDITVGSVGRWHFDPDDPQMPSAEHIRSHLADVDYRNVLVEPLTGAVSLAKAGTRIDLGGIAKVYILEAGLKTLREHGVDNALVNGGGDVVASTARGARPWKVGIRDPRRPARLLATLEVSRGFVASSGDYERAFVRDGRLYHHVIDPRTGYPAQGPHGVTLVADELQAVNGLGTAAMVLEPGAGQALLARSGVHALLARRDGELWITAGLRRRLHSA